MRLRFRIQYHTAWGQQLYVCGSSAELGKWDEAKARPMTYLADGHWALDLDLSSEAEALAYKYMIKHQDHDKSEWEFGENRTLSFPTSAPEEVIVEDQWRSTNSPQQALHTDLFQKILLKRPPTRPSRKSPLKAPFLHRFQLFAPNLSANEVVAITGSDPALGGWTTSKAVILSGRDAPLWSIDIALAAPDKPLEYKFVVLQKQDRTVVQWEAGDNRRLAPVYSPAKSRLFCVTADSFRTTQHWRGTGVAIPVFSLRSKSGTGVGEFTDLKLLVDWATRTGMSMIQILPVNDTISTGTWTDSYPYAAISVFALHPIYANLEEMGQLKDEKAKSAWEKKRSQLNQLPEVDYEGVMAIKNFYFEQLFAQDWKRVSKTKAYLRFFEDNQHWLTPYAVFCSLRDQYGTVNFSEWPEHARYDADAITALADPASPHFDQIALHYFIQFHLDQQLCAVKAYAAQQRVGLKGDIPIGIYRHSVDAWVAPHLYNMEGQAGAPPDAFATAGQNWGFPTYDWEEMAKDGFAWWKARLIHLSRYFDSFRIDHILGFFRIWQIPIEQVQGILGQFNPALPFHREELSNRGLWFDEDRLIRPYIRDHFLEEFVGEYAEAVTAEFLEERPSEPGRYDFKAAYATQRQVEAYLATQILAFPEKAAYYEAIREGLYGLIAQVILLPYPGSQGAAFSPRIAMHFTKSYEALEESTKAILNELYLDFFYHRHESFWRDQAMIKLPAIKEATNMLVCGEDLGMVPECVPGVMEELGLLSLEIQRMPKASHKAFEHPSDAPYLSVISTSTHDMSTVRGWWEEDREVTQQFFNQILGHHGGAPYYCEPWVARDIVQQHLYSPAMWTILPIQDFLAIDGDLRRENPLEEQINVPANPKHYWRYRLHLTLEDLLKASAFNKDLAEMISASGRQ